MDYWSEHPPTHILVAAFMNAKGSATKSKAAPQQPDLDKLKEEIAALGGSVNAKE